MNKSNRNEWKEISNQFKRTRKELMKLSKMAANVLPMDIQKDSLQALKDFEKAENEMGLNDCDDGDS